MLSIPGIWVQATLIGVAAILAGYIRWWLALPFLVLPAVIALSTLGNRYDSSKASAIVEEHGETVFAHAYASAALATFLIGVAIWVGWRRKRKSK